ncbi:IPT/TIG domain-containing protein [Acidobacterium sp.]|uniref:IPT/TIG domain protein n=1 Tax=Acidobacterium capsulatum (strain ATCC 51196 / DSM 11244 / BCRC 80197 / JCM 7670 / NBRC 15755 / NCIMB 13165 / 161) TaxID=240015 RepID=C1F6R6_ACIC5|nr:IPT/TIG domain-containing protein [Acidobacterium sp.]ACO32987.1 IPT/TIG domain protein [Acidobacterium capsulatum ATCC 51196]HCT60958.1 DUF11 domain-containing protein [Acidobacterium sp.]
MGSWGKSWSRVVCLFVFVLVCSASLLISGCGGSNSGSSGGSGSGSSGSGGGTSGTGSSAPVITSVNPGSVTAGSSALTLTVNGSGFISTSVVQVNGSAESTTYVNGTQLTAVVPANQIAVGAELAVTVMNGTVSSSGTTTNLEVDNPVPAIVSYLPSSETAGASSATVTIAGTGFNSATVIQVNGASRTTTYTNPNVVSVTLTAADLSAAGTLSLAAMNPTPGGGTSKPVSLNVITLPQPTIATVSPDSIYINSSDTTIAVNGTGYTSSSVVEWNGTPLKTSLANGYVNTLLATVPAADLTTAGKDSVTVSTPGASPLTSTAATVTVANPPAPVVTYMSPGGGPINTASTITLQGTGFTSNTSIVVNGVTLSTTYNGSTSLTATIPASSLSIPGNISVTAVTPAPGGGTSAAQPFTVYLPVTANDIVYDSTDGMIYASIPATSPELAANTVAAIDPNTGQVKRQIFVGSNPNKLALSSDGTQLFVGLDGAASVAQVDLTQGKVVNQFSLGGGPGIYNPPMKALYLATVPGSPNSVAVATQGTGGGITIYDSGVARTQSWTSGEGPMSFGSSASTLYVLSGSTIEQLTIGTTGVTASSALTTNLTQQQATSLQYDNGNLYLSSGQVVNASTGALAGTFYSEATTAASGAIVSDSTLGKAFVATSSFGSNSDTVLAFDESSYNLLGSFVVNGAGQTGYGSSFEKIVRWGQNGLALNASPGPFTSQSQLFLFQMPLVKDLSSSPADLSVALSAPGTAATGAAVSWVATVKNLGPNSASGVTASITLDPSLQINSIQSSSGSCSSGTIFACDLGSLANGASATITVNATPTQAGTLAGVSTVASTSYDPTASDNQSSTSTTVTGGIYGAVPSLSSISPSLVQAGGSDFTLTVNGTGFNKNSTVNLGTTALTTTYVSSTQLTAAVTAAEVANYGWAAITVSNPTPGGGVSQILPLTIYDLVNVPASGLLFDPYSQLLYATVPGSATSITGNSVVSIDPATGSVGTPVAVGSQPTVMAETSDGNYLYISLTGANSLAKFDLLGKSLAATIPLAITQGSSSTSVTASWLATMPGTDSTLAINQPGEGGIFGIFDVSGSTGSFRTNFSSIYAGDDPVFADASHIYAYDGQTSGAEFYRYSVNANGVSQIDGTTLNGMGGYGGSLQVAGGLVYGEGGGIINPATTPPSQVATLPLIDFYNSGSSPESVGLAADPSLGKEFLMLNNLAGTSAYGLTRYDLSTYAAESVLLMPSSFSAATGSWSVLRWGQDGLALLGSNYDSSTNQTVSSLLLIRGPFVAPQELETDTAATLSSASSSTLTHGSGNTMLTLTGTNFLPGVAVTWNGSYRTTKMEDSTHVTVAIPGSDLATAGSASVVATNPGASASNALTITIQ